MLLVSFCKILVTCAVALKAPVAGGMVLEPRARRLVSAEVRRSFSALPSERQLFRCLLPGQRGRLLEQKFPSAEYVWYLNGQRISGSGTNELQVLTKAEEAASWPWLKRFYHCAVHLKPEMVILSANYSLRLPSLLVEKQNSDRPVVIRPGSIAFVPCPSFRSEPKPVDVFFVVNNTRRLDVDNHSGRLFVSESGLQIADVGPQDQGTYQCVVRNVHSGQLFRGRPVRVRLSTSPATTQAALLYPPTGVSLVRARLGDNVTLQCVISSVAASRIVWVKLNDDLRTMAGVRTRLGNLLLTNVSHAHRGSYVCRSGQASASYVLQVQSPLAVRLRLMSSRLEDGLWLSDLVCDTYGDRSPTLGWFHNGRPLLDADSITVHWSVQRRGRNPRWTATIGSPPPPGVYQCMATSGDESATDSIYVSNWPSTTRRRSTASAHWSELIRVGPTNSTVKLNSTTFLLCQLHSPGATVSWRHNGTLLKLDSRRSLVGYGSLQIRQFDYTDQGWYVCEASDGRWNVTSEAAFVDVEDPTTWSIRRPLTVDTPYDDTYDATVNNHSGTIPKTPLKLAPPQTVRLDNTSVLLRWKLPSELPDRPWLFRIQLRKLADGYDWETLDAEVPGYTNSYVVERLQPNASYRFRYAVIFLNRYQETSAKSKRVTMSLDENGRRIERPSSAPELMTAVSKWPDAIQLKWEQPFGDDAAASPVDGYLVSYRQVYADKPLRFQNETVVGASTREHMIDRLLPATPYEVKLAAYNSAGLSAFSNTLLASTLTLDGKPSSVDFFATDSPPVVVVGQSSRMGINITGSSKISDITSSNHGHMNSGATILRIAGLTMAAVVGCNVLVGLAICLVKRLVRERAIVRRLRTDRRTFADTSRSIFKETHGHHQSQHEEQRQHHQQSADEEHCSGGNIIHPSFACSTTVAKKQQQQQSARSKHHYCRSTEIVVTHPVPEEDPLLAELNTRKRASLPLRSAVECRIQSNLTGYLTQRTAVKQQRYAANLLLDLLRIIHMPRLLFCIHVGLLLINGVSLKPCLKTERLSLIRNWKRSLAHAVLITSSHLFWLYGLVLCGPLRSILIYDISSMVVLSALSSLFVGASGSLKMRGVAFLTLGFLFLMFLDRDYSDAEGFHIHKPSLNHLLYHLFSAFGIADHKAGVVILAFALILRTFAECISSNLCSETSKQRQMRFFSSTFSTIFLLPTVIIWHWLENSTAAPLLPWLTQIIIAISLIFGFGHLLENGPLFTSTMLISRLSSVVSYFISVPVSLIWFHSSIDVAHRISVGVLFATVFLALATVMLTAPNAPKARTGQFVGYSSAGLPLYVSGEDFLQRTSHSLVTFVKNTIHQILAQPDSRRIFFFLCVNLFFTLIEFLYGIWTNSLGLISDAFHMLFDCSALVVGLVAAVMSSWKPTKQFSYGYGRLELLSGFVNGLFLVVIAFFIFLEALERLFDPPEVYTERLLFVSVLGLFVNLFGMFVFTGGHGHSHGGTAHGHSHAGAEVGTASEKKHANYDHHGHTHHQHGHGHSHGHDRSVVNESSLVIMMHDHQQQQQQHDRELNPPAHCHHSHSNANMRGVFLHVLADTLGSVAVILSTMLIHYFGWLIADPLCSLILSIIIGLSVIPLLRESLDALLLKTTPTAAEDLNNILKQLIQMDGVISCSRPRCWIVKSNHHVGTLHIQLTADSDQQYITQEAIRLLKSEGINSPVVQVEKDSFFRHMEALQPSYEPDEPISTYPRERNLLPMAI
ncbi:Zinc transporter 5 [Trichinella pseudospiralis]|uniref:Proton-coupled zinc antiporter SLC30A5 n=2 Tax=Trichinella pseudospiralis TaxID=6337 RepID=A0A0V1E088_TRIPS|nr:Zinc transporter 5 [Trichinella pseudospiralis]